MCRTALPFKIPSHYCAVAPKMAPSAGFVVLALLVAAANVTVTAQGIGLAPAFGPPGNETGTSANATSGQLCERRRGRTCACCGGVSGCRGHPARDPGSVLDFNVCQGRPAPRIAGCKCAIARPVGAKTARRRSLPS